uniref:ATP synthase F0 subunit 8 n=1 Tax=Cryptopygus antarcticus travei TaxID=359048 RepID=A0A5P9W7H1_CRYAT|nr:ATP synthase F0 subunit 8 [Cryptopygus antarcticus travei]
MAPLSWLILFISFSALFMVSIYKMFFISNVKMELPISNYDLLNNQNQLNWKW